MALAQCTVSGVIQLPDTSAPVYGAKLTFVLSNVEEDTEIIAPIRVEAAVNTTTGAFSVDLWPNALGTTESAYYVTLERFGATAARPVAPISLGTIYVPDAASAAFSGLIQTPPFTPPSASILVLANAARDTAAASAVEATSARDAAVSSASSANISEDASAENATNAELAQIAAEAAAVLTAADVVSADAARTAAELAATAAGATIYASLAAGEAATSNGDVFLVASPPAVLIYENDTGSGVFLGWLGRAMFDTFADLDASTATYPVDTLIQVIDRGYTYKAAASGATDHDLTTTGGSQKLYAVAGPDGFKSFQQLGAAGDGVTDDSDVFRVASGQKVRAEAGSTYLLDLNAYTEAINLASGTYWDMTGAKIQYDCFGHPLFYANLNADGVTLIRPHLVFNGTAAANAAALPSNGDMRDEYLIPASGAIGYSCAFYFAGADNVEVVSPKHEALVPGIRKSQYAFFRLNNKFDALLDNDNYTDSDRANLITISDINCNDCNFGILGGGYAQMLFPGSHYFGRYESYDNDASLDYGAPEHRVYISGYLGVEYLGLGHVFDDGLDQTETPTANSANTIKFRKVTSFSVASIVSKCNGGLIDGEGYSNGYFGPMTFIPRDPALMDGTQMRLSFEGAAENLTFTTIDMDLGTSDVQAINILGETGFVVDGVRMGSVSVKQTVSNSYAEIPFQFTLVDNLTGSFRYDVAGGAALSSETILRIEDCDEVDVELTVIGAAKEKFNRISQTTCTNVNIGFRNNNATVFLDNEEIEDGGFIGADIRSTSGKLSRLATTTSGDTTYQLPYEGTFLITFKAFSGGSNGVCNNFIVNWGTAPVITQTTKLGTDFIDGTNFTGLSGAVSATGIVTITATATSTTTMDREIIVMPMGIALGNN